jgi:hypothetical protein
MARILYRSGVSDFRYGDSEPAFLVEGNEDESVFLRLKIALLETDGAQRIGEASDFDGLSVTYENIRALEATGFEWEANAAVEAVTALSRFVQEKRDAVSPASPPPAQG